MRDTSNNFEEQIHSLNNNKFFVIEPKNHKIIIYTILYLLLVVLGAVFNSGYLIAFFHIVPLCIIIGKNFNYFLTVALAGIFLSYFLGTIYITFWHTSHIILAAVIYFSIVKRYSKLVIIVLLSSTLFLLLALFLTVLIKLNYINLNIINQNIDNYLKESVERALTFNPGVSRDLYLASINTFKQILPAILFQGILLYIFLLITYALKRLSLEGVITPIFPPFATIKVRGSIVTVYIFLLIALLFIDVNSGYQKYNIILQNIFLIMQLVFAFNGMCTLFFFIDEKLNKNIFLKILNVILLIIFPSILEIVGIIDSIISLREKYLKMK